ncbi:hypothetical protein [Wolbachia endosymbiont (group B) of Horisme vitalbata]
MQQSPLGSIYNKSCNKQKIVGVYVKNNVCDEIDWIPASRAGMTSS